MKYSPEDVYTVSTHGINKTIQVGGFRVSESEWESIQQFLITRTDAATQTLPTEVKLQTGHIVGLYSSGHTHNLVRKTAYRLIRDETAEDWRQKYRLIPANPVMDSIHMSKSYSETTLDGPTDIESLEDQLRIVGIRDHLIGTRFENGHKTCITQI